MGGDIGDGLWHLYEIHLKMDTNGANGIAEAWVDGVKRIDHSAANFGGAQGAPGWSGLEIASNARNPLNGRCMAVDYDDVAIATTGPIGSIGPGDTTSPAAPTNLTVQ